MDITGMGSDGEKKPIEIDVVALDDMMELSWSARCRT